VDQYAATLGNWFGVSATDMQTAIPHISNYVGSPLGTQLGFV
jgi:hypothetical protein